MDAHLVYPLQGVVHRLGVALELAGDDLVGAAVEVEGEDATLQVGEDARNAGQAGDEAFQLFGGDHQQDQPEPVEDTKKKKRIASVR